MASARPMASCCCWPPERSPPRRRSICESTGNISKTRAIVKLCAALIETFGGQVPRTAAALRTLPGIGRKSAEVTANFAFGEKVIAVDTHVFRVSNRIPLAAGRTVDAVADGLVARVPDAYKDGAHIWLFRHGRDTCTARKPACLRCPVADLCTWPEKSAFA